MSRSIDTVTSSRPSAQAPNAHGLCVLAKDYESIVELPPLFSQHLLARRSEIPKTLSPDVVQAARTAREVVRDRRAVELHTRLIVLGIWGTAVVLVTTLLVLFATSS